MTPEQIAGASEAELAAGYRAAAAAHGQGTLDGRYKMVAVNTTCWSPIYRELRKRDKAKEVLLPLLSDPDDGVRNRSAGHALEFAPEAAERVLTELAAKPDLIAFTAEWTLRERRKGNLSFE